MKDQSILNFIKNKQYIEPDQSKQPCSEVGCPLVVIFCIRDSFRKDDFGGEDDTDHEHNNVEYDEDEDEDDDGDGDHDDYGVKDKVANSCCLYWL